MITTIFTSGSSRWPLHWPRVLLRIPLHSRPPYTHAVRCELIGLLRHTWQIGPRESWRIHRVLGQLSVDLPGQKFPDESALFLRPYEQKLAVEVASFLCGWIVLPGAEDCSELWKVKEIHSIYQSIKRSNTRKYLLKALSRPIHVPIPSLPLDRQYTCTPDWQMRLRSTRNTSWKWTWSRVPDRLQRVTGPNGKSEIADASWDVSKNNPHIASAKKHFVVKALVLNGTWKCDVRTITDCKAHATFTQR